MWIVRGVASVVFGTEGALEAKRDEQRSKHATQRAELKKRADKLQESWAAKIASIQEKASKAKAEAKARHEQHMDKLSRFADAQKDAFRQLFA